jgi:hypothetical protein
MSDVLGPSPTEGWILREQDQEAYQDAVGRDIVEFFAAVDAGRRDVWIQEFFSTQYPTDLGNEEVVTDILLVHDRRFTLSVAECERCGRLWVQRRPGANSYRSFPPDEPGYAGVLRSRPIRE